MWNETFGGFGGHSVQETRDGGYVIIGTVSSGAGNYDVRLIKTDSAGNRIWARTFGGAGYDRGYSVQQTTDYGYVIAGETYSYDSGNTDVWLIKTNSAGNKLWDKTFGGTRGDCGESVQETADGGYVIAGETYSYGSGNTDVWLVKTDSLGNEMWNETFGGITIDFCKSVQVTDDGGYVIVGTTVSYSAGNTDIWLIKVKSRCTLYYPYFKDTKDPNSWRTWFVIQNPTGESAKIYFVLRSGNASLLYSGGISLGPYAAALISPRTLVGSDCAGSAIVTSDQPLKAVCYINSTEMCMSYPAIGSE